MAQNKVYDQHMILNLNGYRSAAFSNITESKYTSKFRKKTNRFKVKKKSKP